MSSLAHCTFHESLTPSSPIYLLMSSRSILLFGRRCLIAHWQLVLSQSVLYCSPLIARFCCVFCARILGSLSYLFLAYFREKKIKNYRRSSSARLGSIRYESKDRIEPYFLAEFLLSLAQAKKSLSHEFLAHEPAQLCSVR